MPGVSLINLLISYCISLILFHRHELIILIAYINLKKRQINFFTLVALVFCGMEERRYQECGHYEKGKMNMEPQA